MKRASLILSFFLLAHPGPLHALRAAEVAAKPNVVLILADDIGYDYDPHEVTPELVKRSLKFIEENQGCPFFLFLSTQNIHDPLTPSAKFSGHPDGLSLVSFLKGGAAPRRDYLYWELHESKPIQAVRFGDWKAVRNGPDAAIELYDLKTDPAEAKDLAAGEPALVDRAAEWMRMARTDDPEWPMAEARTLKK